MSSATGRPTSHSGSHDSLSPEELSAKLLVLKPRILVALRARLSQALAAKVDVEDLWQETLLNVMKSAKDLRWQGPEALLRWVMTIAARTVATTSRRLMGRDRVRPDLISMEDVALYIAQSCTGPATQAERSDEINRVFLMLQGLPPVQRHVLTLDLVHLMTHREMAEVLEKSLDSVRKAHLRALTSLRAALTAPPGDQKA